jgi:hypothetical protein
MDGPFDTMRVVHGAPEIVQAHTAAVGAGWDIAIRVANSHWDLLGASIATAGESADAATIGVVTIATHGLNLYVEVLSAAARGMFDAGAHLLRGLADCAGLAFSVGTIPGAMDRFMAGEEGSAATGRKAAIEELRIADPVLAARKAAEWRERQKQLHQTAHVSLFHADRVVEPLEGGLRPVVGGRVSPEMARSLVYAAMSSDNEFLMHLSYLRARFFAEDWSGRLSELQTEMKAWWKETPEGRGQIRE